MPLGTVYILHAVERYCTTTAVGLIVPPSIEGFITVVAAGGPPLLLLCGVVLCVVRCRRALSLPQITICCDNSINITGGRGFCRPREGEGTSFGGRENLCDGRGKFRVEGTIDKL